MIQKINRYLLTHRPLLWNTRVIWVLLTNLLLHGLFLLSGYFSLHVYELKNIGYYRGDVTLFTFSMLCSLAVIITWLIFYLRNNAFKSFYRITRFHLLKEALIVSLIFFTSITYFISYDKGTSLRINSITSREELVKEVNITNLAMAFIPRQEENYFILCNYENKNSPVYYDDSRDYSDTINNSVTDTNNIKIRAALKHPDAFSYAHYCVPFFRLEGYEGYADTAAWYYRKNNWLAQNQQDSVRQILEDFLAICDKYALTDKQLNTELLTSYVFRSPAHTISKLVATTKYDNKDHLNELYLNTYPLDSIFNLIDRSHAGRIRGLWSDELIVVLYFTLSFTILLLLFRWYSKKVFLIGLLGCIVWGIVFGLIGATSRSSVTVCYCFLFLLVIFAALAVRGLHIRNHKTLTGILLNWSIYMIPILPAIVLELVGDYYYHRVSFSVDYPERLSDEAMQQYFPISYWISHHTKEVIILALTISFIYLFAGFTRLSKKWHYLPEE